MSTPPSDPGASPNRPMRLEIGVVVLVALILLVGGGLYVLVAGSPTKSRQSIDNPDTVVPMNTVVKPTANAPAPVKPAKP